MNFKNELYRKLIHLASVIIPMSYYYFFSREIILLILLFFANFVQSQSLLFDDRDDFISISPSEEVENMEGINIRTCIYKEKN